MPKDRDELKLLAAMGAETANIHLGTPKVADNIQRYLRKQPASWLHSAAKDMARMVEADWRAWRKSGA